MIHSRDITELLPTVRSMCVHLLTECAAKGVDLVITSTFRDHEAQAQLWRHGRGNGERIVTHRPANWSTHQWRCAFDVMVLRHGKPISQHLCDPWEFDLWHQVGEIGERAVGLVWGGRFEGVTQEREHFEHTYGRTINDLVGGASLPETLDGHVIRFDSNGSAGWRARMRALVPARVASISA